MRMQNRVSEGIVKQMQQEKDRKMKKKHDRITTSTNRDTQPASINTHHHSHHAQPKSSTQENIPCTTVIPAVSVQSPIKIKHYKGEQTRHPGNTRRERTRWIPMSEILSSNVGQHVFSPPEERRRHQLNIQISRRWMIPDTYSHGVEKTALMASQAWGEIDSLISDLIEGHGFIISTIPMVEIFGLGDRGNLGKVEAELTRPENRNTYISVEDFMRIVEPGGIIAEYDPPSEFGIFEHREFGLYILYVGQVAHLTNERELSLQPMVFTPRTWSKIARNSQYIIASKGIGLQLQLSVGHSIERRVRTTRRQLDEILSVAAGAEGGRIKALVPYPTTYSGDYGIHANIIVPIYFPAMLNSADEQTGSHLVISWSDQSDTGTSMSIYMSLEREQAEGVFRNKTDLPCSLRLKSPISKRQVNGIIRQPDGRIFYVHLGIDCPEGLYIFGSDATTQYPISEVDNDASKIPTNIDFVPSIQEPFPPNIVTLAPYVWTTESRAWSYVYPLQDSKEVRRDYFDHFNHCQRIDKPDLPVKSYGIYVTSGSIAGLNTAMRHACAFFNRTSGLCAIYQFFDPRGTILMAASMLDRNKNLESLEEGQAYVGGVNIFDDRGNVAYPDGFDPRFKPIHTYTREAGYYYIPSIHAACWTEVVISAIILAPVGLEIPIRDEVGLIYLAENKYPPLDRIGDLELAVLLQEISVKYYFKTEKALDVHAYISLSFLIIQEMERRKLIPLDGSLAWINIIRGRIVDVLIRNRLVSYQ